MGNDVAGQRRSSSIVRELTFRLRGILHVPAVVVIFIWSNPTADSLWYGGLTILVGESIRLWAAGYIETYRVSRVQAARLVTAGPYAHVRNPLYWGNFLIGLGYVIAADWWPGYLIFGAVFFYVYGSVVPLEEKYLENTFQEQYGAYRKDVPRMVPRLSAYSGAQGAFSLRVALGGESTTIAIWALMTGLLAAKLFL